MPKYKTQRIEVANIFLDPQNPRHDVVASQRDAILAICQKQKGKLITLAKDILLNGINPADLPIVIPHPSEDEKFIVLEGNRRIATLRLLMAPNLLPKTGDLSGLRGQFKKIAERFQENIIDKVRCVIYQERKDAKHWITLKHTGENDGAGTVEWGATEKQLFNEREGGKKSTALQAIDFIKENGNLPQETIKKTKSIAITNLERLLTDKHIQQALGFRINNGILTTNLPQEEVTKGLSRIVTDLAHKKIKVGDIYDIGLRKDYLEKFDKNEIPDQSQASPKSSPLDSIPQTKPQPASHPKTPAKKSIPLSVKRRTLIPSGCVLRIPNQPKINSVYRELKDLTVDDFPNASAALMRIFLELSVGHFIDANEIKISEDKPLRTKLEKVADFMTDKKLLTPNQLKQVRVATSNKDALFSANTFNNYIHNRYFTPKTRELKVTWDNMQLFMEAIWP